LNAAQVGPGTFLIASPLLRDPNFHRTVVLLCEHEEDEGSMGVIVNRPGDRMLEEALSGVEPHASQRLWLGGPVQPDAVLVLHRKPELPGARLIVDGMAMGGDDAVLLDLLRAADPRRARVFSGYAGWGAGQLGAELEQRSWITCTAQARFVFDTEAGDVWSAVLRSLGPRYAYLADLPADPRVN
jgi:putative transcriptional regulator